MDMEPVIVKAREARSIWLLRDHLTPLIGPQHTQGRFALALAAMHPGDGPPPHLHQNEDEAFYVLEGEVTFLCGDTQVRAPAGSFVWAPRDVIHCFRCTSPTPAKQLLFVSPTEFLKFAVTLAEPANDFMNPPVIDEKKIGQLMQVAPQFGITMMPQHVIPGLIVPAAAPRKRLWCLGEDVSYLATSEQTRGEFTIVEINTTPGGGPPPHVHTAQDEAFYVLSGTHRILFDGKTDEAGPGDAVFIPRGTRHCYSNSGTTPGKLLSIHTPGGFERFFDEVGLPYEAHPVAPPPPPMTPEQLQALLGRHGMTL